MRRSIPLVLLLAACAPADPPADDTTSDDAVVETDTPSGAHTDPPADTVVVDSDSDRPIDVETDVETDVGADTEPPVDTDTDPPTVTDCFGGAWTPAHTPDYASLNPVMGHHCKGTNHQDITGVQRVVFLGDSITLGTPPTPTNLWYRNRLVDRFVRKWGLRPPSQEWRFADLINGTALTTFSGDFAVCAQYGARTDDMLDGPHYQVETCMPEADRALTTLVIMTVGGNDIYSLLEDVNAGVDEATLRQTFGDEVQRLRDTVEWIVAPGRFPNGVYVVFANLYDFSDPDGAEDMAQCTGAQLIGLDDPLRDPVFQSIIADAEQEYLSIAVDTQTDLAFLGELFCGHGWNNTDPTSRCYRGPGASTWLDLTCEHPNTAGTAALASMFEAVVDE